jgi:hypothetical protein
MTPLRRYLPWSFTTIATLAALYLAHINVRQQEELADRHRVEALDNWYKRSLFNDYLVDRSAKLARLNRAPVSDEAYYGDVWPSVVDLPGETCVGLSDMGIGGSFTHCFDDRTKKLIRAYSFPDEGPPKSLSYENADPRLVNARTDTSYMSPDGRSPWPTPEVIRPKTGSATASPREDRGR